MLPFLHLEYTHKNNARSLLQLCISKICLPDSICQQCHGAEPIWVIIQLLHFIKKVIHIHSLIIFHVGRDEGDNGGYIKEGLLVKNLTSIKDHVGNDVNSMAHFIEQVLDEGLYVIHDRVDVAVV